MKNLLLFLVWVLNLPSLVAGAAVETVVASPEEILASKAWLTCEVFRRNDGNVALKVGAKAPSGGKSYFEGFDLRVFKQPIAASEVKEKVLRDDLLAWHRPSERGVVLFVLTEEELSQSYVVGHWSMGPSNGVFQVKHVCFSVAAMVDATAKKPH